MNYRNRAALFWGSTLAAALATSGCCYVPISATPRAAQPLPESLAATYACEREQAVTASRRELKAKSKFSIQRIELSGKGASSSTNRNLIFDYYLPVRAAKHPVILVLPIFGGKSYPLENHFASYFAKHGLAAVIVHREKFNQDSPTAEQINAMLAQTVLDNKRVINWIEGQPELDAKRIGVFGASMGAIKGALLTPLEGRVQAAVLGLVGGDIPYIVSYSTEKGLARHRRAYLQKQAISARDLEMRLRDGIACDPNALAPYVDPRKVLLILAGCDTVVPTGKGLELRRKMGKPETIIVPAGHYSAVLYLPYIKGQSIRFFRDRFAEVQSSQVQARK